MRKLILVSITACAAISIFAAAKHTGDPRSANIVGYTTVHLRQGYNMLALNFDQVGWPMAGMDLNTLIPGKTANLTAGNAETADQVLVFSGDECAMYYLYYSTNVLTHFNYRWVADGPVLCTNRFRSGAAFLYNKRGAVPVAIKISGQVPEDVSKTHAIVAGYNMIGSVYSTDWDPNALGATCWATNGAVHGSAADSADTILTFSGATGTLYFLWYSTTTETALNNQWVSLPGPTRAPKNFVKLGTGVWYHHHGQGFTLPQTLPYAL